jgi:mRNA-degrading endonuclease YafQ of YafQ-DinJ toxin-antitoxin module
MQIRTHKHYEKMWTKLSRKQQLQVLAALKIYIEIQNVEKLRVHQLQGEYYPQYSISAGGDLRVHFLKLDNDSIVLMTVGTHSQLYG